MGLRIQKADLLGFLDGHHKANEVIRDEKRERLSRLTAEESRLEYDSLCAIWEANSKEEDTEVVDRQRLSFLIERRRRLNTVSGFLKRQ
jgi:hypothetical protein